MRFRYGAIVAIFLLGLLLFVPFCVGEAHAEQTPMAAENNEAATVDIGVYLLTISDFDSLKGTYHLEFYVYMYWNPMVTTEPDLQLINAISYTNETVSREYTEGGEMVWQMYRATMFTTPDGKNYPFDSIEIKVVIEDDVHDISQTKFDWITGKSGVDDLFITSGWDQKGTSYNITSHTYPWDKTYSQATFSLKLERRSLSSAGNILLPPIIFCFVSFLAFIISPVKESPLMVRLSLGTGMIISAVLFHVAQSAMLPPFGEIRMLDIIMISSYTAIAISIFVTVMCHVYHAKGSPDKKVLALNRNGLVLALLTPFICYLVLAWIFL